MNVKFINLILLLFVTGCAHQKNTFSPYDLENDFSLTIDDAVSRKNSAAPKEFSEKLLKILNPHYISLNGLQSTNTDKLTLDKLAFQFGKSSDTPEPLDGIYVGFMNKGMSVQAFKKIANDWPKVAVDLNIIILYLFRSQ